MGWLHFDNGTYHQIKTRNGGGTRHLSVEKSVTMGELLETGKGLFFPNGYSSKGPMEDLEFDIRDFGHNAVSPEVTVSQLYEQTKIQMLRIYTTSKAKDVILLSDASFDFEPTDERPMKTRTMQRRSLRNKTRRRHHWRTGTDHRVDHPESSTDLDPAPSGSMQENHEKHSTLNDGPVSSSSLLASPDPFEKEPLVKLRQVNIVDDVLNIFIEPKILNANLKMEFTNEKAVESDGIMGAGEEQFYEPSLNVLLGTHCMVEDVYEDEKNLISIPLWDRTTGAVQCFLSV
ncbi:uncharacterized protein LOC127361993 [Dicentrarchus labrax]|uniref:uncharacterized protein LOC127361993 n=1 Tax=Dicentrarchus labrax TaxID=13489 RepID=UPI0021F6108A|nr:uncharacterized protein LOC127361993 [Dicentrarchus labrax]